MEGAGLGGEALFARGRRYSVDCRREGRDEAGGQKGGRPHTK